MAVSNAFQLTLGFLFMLLGLRGVQSAIQCEQLPLDVCAFSVSSGGNRCVLEKSVTKDGTLQFQCQSSVVMAETLIEWIESDECINACGLERMSVGMSSDSLLEAEFANKLCSSQCQNHCPNIVDLYLNLAAGEGVYLPSLCEAQRSRSRRSIAEILKNTKSSITEETFGANSPESSPFGHQLAFDSELSPSPEPASF
eukprot:Gb_20186 [translate_table: standard]